MTSSLFQKSSSRDGIFGKGKSVKIREKKVKRIISSCQLHPSIFMVIMTRPPSCTTPRQPTKNNDWRGLCCLGCIIDICFEIVVQYFDPVNEFWAKTASRAFNILFNCYT